MWEPNTIWWATQGHHRDRSSRRLLAGAHQKFRNTVTSLPIRKSPRQNSNKSGYSTRGCHATAFSPTLMRGGQTPTAPSAREAPPREKIASENRQNSKCEGARSRLADHRDLCPVKSRRGPPGIFVRKAQRAPLANTGGRQDPGRQPLDLALPYRQIE